MIFLTVSCEKDWLNVSTSAQIEADEQFKSSEGFKDALIGVYIGMTSPELYAKDMTWNLVDILSQQYADLRGGALYTDVQQFQYRTTRSTDQIDALWINAYNVLANINIILDYIETNGDVLDPIDYSIIKGELLGLRAFLHFDLMRLYGYGDLADRNVSTEYTIPYVTEFTKEVTPQRTYAETFELMENDIAEALELLKMDPIYTGIDRPEDYYEAVNRDGFYNNRELRMNYYAVKALQARVHLWQGSPEDLEKARVAAEEVIFEGPFEMINSGTYPVASDPIFYPEMIFGLNITGFADIVNPYHDASKATNDNALYFTQNSAAEIFETSNTDIGVADVRFNTLLETQAGGLVSIKLVQDDVLHYDTMLLVTLPEMYYIAAEAYLSTNNLQKAIEYLNTVRSSRGIIAQIPDTADKETVAGEIFKEYRKEFISEGQLFFYYKRLGRETIPGLSETVTLNDDVYVLPYPDNELEFGNR